MKNLTLSSSAVLPEKAPVQIVDLINQRLKLIPFAPCKDIREAGNCLGITAELAHFLVLNSNIRTRKWTAFVQRYEGEKIPNQPIEVGNDDLWVIDPEEKADFSSIIPQTCQKLPCPDCQGKGEVDCPKCKGHGQVKCHNCRGTGQQTEYENVNEQVQCSNCNGRGQTFDRTCDYCNGRGSRIESVRKEKQVSCRDCGGRGQVECHKCSGSGKVPCDTCLGTGVVLAGYKLEQQNSVDVKVLGAMSSGLSALVAIPENESGIGHASVISEFVTAGFGEDLQELSGDHGSVLRQDYVAVMAELHGSISRVDRQAGKLLAKEYCIYSFTPDKLTGVENPTAPLTIAAALDDSKVYAELALSSLASGDFATAERALQNGNESEAMRQGLIAMFKSSREPKAVALVEQLAARGTHCRKIALLIWLVLTFTTAFLMVNSTLPMVAVVITGIIGLPVTLAVCRAGCRNLVWRSRILQFKLSLGLALYTVVAGIMGGMVSLLWLLSNNGALPAAKELYLVTLAALLLYSLIQPLCVCNVNRLLKLKMPTADQKNGEKKVRKIERAVLGFVQSSPLVTLLIVFGPLLLIFTIQALLFLQ